MIVFKFLVIGLAVTTLIGANILLWILVIDHLIDHLQRWRRL